MTRARLAFHPAGVFFALAAAFAAALPWLWQLPLDDPRMAHLRLGFFGFGGAAVAGYLLTAQKAWTGREAPLPALALGGMALAARVAALSAPGQVAPVLLPTAIIGLAVIWPVLAAHRWRRLPLASVPMALALAEAALVRGALPPVPSPQVLATVMTGLVLVVGGRAVPAFLAAERARAGRSGPAIGPMWPGVASFALGAALPGPAGDLAWGICALWVLGRSLAGRTAGAANRMLCLAYAGLLPALTGRIVADLGALPAIAALHLQTMGAMGAMILAVAARASMARHDGRLRPGRRHWLALALVLVSAALRAGAELAADPAPWIIAAGAGWSGGWLMFLSAHLAALPRPAPFPILSGARASQAAS